MSTADKQGTLLFTKTQEHAGFYGLGPGNKNLDDHIPGYATIVENQTTFNGESTYQHSVQTLTGLLEIFQLDQNQDWEIFK